VLAQLTASQTAACSTCIVLPCTIKANLQDIVSNLIHWGKITKNFFLPCPIPQLPAHKLVPIHLFPGDAHGKTAS